MERVSHSVPELFVVDFDIVDGRFEDAGALVPQLDAWISIGVECGQFGEFCELSECEFLCFVEGHDEEEFLVRGRRRCGVLSRRRWCRCSRWTRDALWCSVSKDVARHENSDFMTGRAAFFYKILSIVKLMQASRL